MDELAEIEAIKRLKYKYLRCVDTKNWDELVKKYKGIIHTYASY